MEKIYFILDEYDRRIIKASLESFGTGTVALMAFPGSNIKLLDGMDKIRFCEPSYYSEVYTGVLDRVKNRKIYISDIKNISAEKRAEVKVKIHYQGILIPTQVEGLKRDNIQIIVQDISCGGIGFYTNGSCLMHDKFETIIPITEEPLIMQVEIVRKEMDEEVGMYLCGARFMNMSSNEERAIRAAVYKYEIVSRKRKLKEQGKKDGIKK